jgi:hypothetical protein
MALDNQSAKSPGPSDFELYLVLEWFPYPPRAYWKGYLELSLVSCPVALLVERLKCESWNYGYDAKTSAPKVHA